MGKSMFFGAVCLWATVLLAGGKVTPLNVKTGLWETTSTTMINGSIGWPVAHRIDVAVPEPQECSTPYVWFELSDP